MLYSCLSSRTKNVLYQVGLFGYCVPYYSWEQLNPIEHGDAVGGLHTQLAHQCQSHNKGRHVCSEREMIANHQFYEWYSSDHDQSVLMYCISMTGSLTAELGNEEGQHTGNATEEQRAHAERPTAKSLQQKWKQQRGSL